MRSASGIPRSSSACRFASPLGKIMVGALPSRTCPNIESHRQLGSDAVYKWVLVGSLFFVGMLNYADRTSITSVYALLKTDLGFTDAGLGAIGYLFLWSYALASPLSGYIGDRVDRGRVILWSLTAWSLVTLVTGLVTARWQLLGLRVLLGLVESLYIPAAMALVAEYHPLSTRATALGIITVGEELGLVGGGTLAGYLGDRYGWKQPLWVLGVTGVLLAGICYFILPHKKSGVAAAETQGSGGALRLSFAEAFLHLLKIPSFIVLAAAAVLTSIGSWIFVNWLPLYFKETFRMTLASAGFFGSALVSLTAAATNVAGGVVSDRLAARKGVHYRMLLQAVLIALSAPMLLAFTYTRNLTVIMVALVLYSVFRTGGDVNIIPLLSDISGKDKRATAFGLTNMVNTVAGGLGVFVAGLLKADLGLTRIFAGLTSILLIDALLLLVGYVVFLRKDLEKASMSDQRRGLMES